MLNASTDSLDDLAARAAARFEQRFGRRPRWIAAAPGRVNIIGEHVDYNDGFVLPMAIDRYCVIAAGDSPVAHSTSEPPVATIFSATADGEVRIDVAAPKVATAGHWSNYVSGVVAGFLARHERVPSFDAVIDSTVPLGGGLSSSAALEVAAATLLEAMLGTNLEPADKALLCQRAEHEFAGMPCGIMDQFASVMGRADHLMLLDCRSQHVEHIPFVDANVTVLIVNSNVKHELTGSEYAERRAQCESAARKLGVASLRDARYPQLQARRSALEANEYRRAKHVVTEIGRTAKAVSALKAGDWVEVGRMMYGSHESLRDDFEVSCLELDSLVTAAREIGPRGGVIGSRMTGGGFGGCTVSLVETDKVESVASRLMTEYRRETGIEASALVSRPARGAHVLRI